jgi:type II secretory pathway component PulC
MRHGLRRSSVLRDSVLGVALTVALSLPLGSAAGCGGADTREDEALVAEEPTAPEAPREPFTIYRDELEQTLQRGLQPLIADVNLRPELDGGRFVGWRVQFLAPAESPFRESAVRPGDVLVRVNDAPIERPDQMMALWKSLESADHVTFHVLRGGKPVDLTYRVVERPAAP